MLGGKTLLVLFLSLISLQAFAENLTDDQYWNQTGLNFEAVKSKFRGSCYKNAVGFVACVRALSEAATLMSPAGVFALDQEVQGGSPVVGTLIKSYGQLQLYNYKSMPNTGLATYWPTYKSARDLQIKVATDFYQQGHSLEVDFGAILADLKEKILVGKMADSEGRVAALLINSFLASAVDPHTRIQPRAQIDANSKSLDVSFPGIGVSVMATDNQFVIQNPFPDGPALAAGVKAKDVIVSIDGEKTEKKKLSDVTTALTGEKGTKVKIGLLRKGMPLEIEVIRGTVVISNIQSEMLNDADFPIGYIRLLSFMESDVCQKMETIILDFQNKGAKGLVLDLRGNGGGYMHVAVCIGSLFVGKQVIVSQVDIKDGKKTPYPGQKAAVTNLPLVTLIDGASASASEILAGALQDYQRSWIAGDRSYGKATVQSESDWLSAPKTWNLYKKISYYWGHKETIGLWHTISRFYQPTGRTNQIVGIIPNFYVDPFPGAKESDRFALREEDLYTNALPPLGAPWKESRPEKVASISNCLNSQSRAKVIFDNKQDDAISPDYRVIASEVLLACDR